MIISSSRRTCARVLGHSTYQSVTATLRMVAYGMHVDIVGDHLAMGGSPCIKCVKWFVGSMVEVFGSEYLRATNAQDTTQLLE
jgi:hypothetical protein